MAIPHNLTLDGSKIAHLTARRGLLRGEFRELVGVSSVTIAKVFASRPVGVVTARNVAKALKIPLCRILAQEPEAVTT